MKEKKIRGWLIKEIEITSGNGAFDQMKKHLGWGEDRYLTPVSIGSSLGRCHMFVDEEGERKNLTPNPVASSFYASDTPLLGDVIILEGMLK